LVDIKAVRDSSFNIFIKKGVRLWSGETYDKTQAIMGMTEIDKCLVMVFNKDSGEIKEEVIYFDKDRYMQLIEKAKKIQDSQEPLDRINDSPSFFMCKICAFKAPCHSSDR